MYKIEKKKEKTTIHIEAEHKIIISDIKIQKKTTCTPHNNYSTYEEGVSSIKTANVRVSLVLRSSYTPHKATTTTSAYRTQKRQLITIIIIILFKQIWHERKKKKKNGNEAEEWRKKK